MAGERGRSDRPGEPEADAFGEADERLLSTVASSTGVALENARLFDETRRLLVETDQRAAELAVVNEIGQALATQLEFEAIVELVGERLRRSSRPHARDLFIALYDRAADLIPFPYWLDDGQRLQDEPVELGQGLTSIVISRGGPCGSARSRRPPPARSPRGGGGDRFVARRPDPGGRPT